MTDHPTMTIAGRWLGARARLLLSLPVILVAALACLLPLTDGIAAGHAGIAPTGPGLGSRYDVPAADSGSGSQPAVDAGLPPDPDEATAVSLALVAPHKFTLLAWAGQRVLLEYDWRSPAGDNADGTPAGVCPFSAPNNVITYVRGSGPGTFVAGLGSISVDADSLSVAVTGASQMESAPAAPQGSCISRAVYYSADAGQVDVEAFLAADAENNKATFVVYYMQIERVSVTLVTQATNPYHNSSLLRVFEPGNPWAVSSDNTSGAVDWNVSRDLLVRGRTAGWFLNANPSGRAADLSNPLNELPANRWVLPDDWALLAGGPADNANGTPAVGTAEQFRPYYDIMFAPNNAAGIALGETAGVNRVQVATVATQASVTNTATTFGVTSVANLDVGTAILVGWDLTARTVASYTASPPSITLTVPLDATPSVGTQLWLAGTVEFAGPFSTVDITAGGGDARTYGSIGLTNGGIAGGAAGQIALTRDTALGDGDVSIWDAPMPPLLISAKVRGAGFIKSVEKRDVYWTGDFTTGQRVFTNPFYRTNIPASPFLPAAVAGGGYHWDSWGNDGPAGGNGLWSSISDGESGQVAYTFWKPIPTFLADGTPGQDSAGVADGTVTPAQLAELNAIRAAYEDTTIGRDLVLYSDNHGEFMVLVNGDFKQDYSACAANALAGGRQCKTGDAVGAGFLSTVADYPDLRGNHTPVASNQVTVTWRWGGYTSFSVEPGDTSTVTYLVLHALDRDGFCQPPTVPAQFPSLAGAVLLHSVLSTLDDDNTIAGDPIQLVDATVTGGTIVGTSGGGSLGAGNTSITGVRFFSTAANGPGGVREFPLSTLASPGQADECQAWIRVDHAADASISATATVHDDAGDLGFATGGPPGEIDRLAFTTQPGDASAAGAALSAAPSVTVLDTNDAVFTSFNGPVTIAIAGGTAGATLTCTGGLTHNAVNGVAAFPGCSVDRPGGSYFLVATASGLSAVLSGFFKIEGPLVQSPPSYGDGPGLGDFFSLIGGPGLQAAASPTLSIELHWSDNANDETGYRVLRFTAGGWTNISGDLPPNTESYTDTGLVPGVYYAYWIVGIKNGGLVYAPTYMTIIAPRPAAPVPIAAASISTTQVRIQWSDSSTSEDGYRVLRYINGSWVDVSGDLPADTVSFVDGANAQFPLLPGTTYAYWLVGFRGADPASVIYAPAYIAASTPASVAANAPVYAPASVTTTTATINWLPAGGTAAATGYRVIRLGANGWSIVSGSSPLAPGTTTFTDTGLTPGYYAYWVYGVNGANETYAGSYQTIVAGLPPPPGPVSASGAGSGAIHLTWSDFATSEEGYDVQRYINGAWVTVGSVGPGVTEFTDTGGLVAGGTYAYWILARAGTFNIYAGGFIAAIAY